MPLTSEEQWEIERTWPLFKVVLTGDEVEYVARAGMNENEDGVPQPWRAIARCEVLVRAKNDEHAKALAFRSEVDAGYHTVESVQEVEDE